MLYYIYHNATVHKWILQYKVLKFLRFFGRVENNLYLYAVTLYIFSVFGKPAPPQPVRELLLPFFQLSIYKSQYL